LRWVAIKSYSQAFPQVLTDRYIADSPETSREREREKDRLRHADSEKEKTKRQTNIETETERQADRQRERERGKQTKGRLTYTEYTLVMLLL